MGKKRGPGQPRKGFDECLMARLSKGTLQRIETVLKEGEKQADFARTAIASEIKRRQSKPKPA